MKKPPPTPTPPSPPTSPPLTHPTPPTPSLSASAPHCSASDPASGSFLPPIGPKMGYATADIPGIGGVLNQRHSDFIVQEIPLYEPQGHGEHLYLFIQKQGLNTLHVRKTLAKHFNVRKSDVSYAGQKDKNAITRQLFSIYLPKLKDDQPLLASLNAQAQKLRFDVLWADRHANKLRLGHLKANRFTIKIRQVQPTDAVRVHTMLKQLSALGCPNFFGKQRFGFNQNNHLMGGYLIAQKPQALLDDMLGTQHTLQTDRTFYARNAYQNGDFPQALEHWPQSQRPERQALAALAQRGTAAQAVNTIDTKHRLFLACSAQSFVFNLLLKQRLADGTWCQLMPGELAFKHDNGALFATTAEDMAQENGPSGRVPTLAISGSGPLWGAKMPRAEDQADAMECQALADAGLSVDDFLAKNPYLPYLNGDRRALRMAVEDVDVSGGADEHGPYVQTHFTLGKGCFATAVLRELMKC